MERRPGGVYLSQALIEGDNQVAEVVRRRPRLLPGRIPHLEGVQPMRRGRPKDSGYSILLGLVEAQLDTHLGPGVAVHRQMDAAELPLVGYVGEHT